MKSLVVVWGDCEAAVLAGIDIFMVTARKDWMSFRTSLLDSVNNKTVPMSRIDDAVSRILRVKMRAGMWDKPMPSQRTLAGNRAFLGILTTAHWQGRQFVSPWYC